MTKRKSHKNDKRRITNAERVVDIEGWMKDCGIIGRYGLSRNERAYLLRTIQAACRAALSRERARRGRGSR